MEIVLPDAIWNYQNKDRQKNTNWKLRYDNEIEFLRKGFFKRQLLLWNNLPKKMIKKKVIYDTMKKRRKFFRFQRYGNEIDRPQSRKKCWSVYHFPKLVAIINPFYSSITFSFTSVVMTASWNKSAFSTILGRKSAVLFRSTIGNQSFCFAWYLAIKRAVLVNLIFQMF